VLLADQGTTEGEERDGYHCTAFLTETRNKHFIPFHWLSAGEFRKRLPCFVVPFLLKQIPAPTMRIKRAFCNDFLIKPF
jgi:hypothetical protein